MKSIDFINKRVLWFTAALFALSIPQVWGTTVTKTMTEIFSANSYTLSYTSGGVTYATMYKELALDSHITVSTSGEDNCGSFWGDPTREWRIYQNKGGDVTITAESGYELESVTFTYGQGNSGILNTSGNGSSIATSYRKASETAIDVSGSSYTIYVGNTGTGSNGQVKITKISVTYSATASCGSATPSATGTASLNGSFFWTTFFEPVRPCVEPRGAH